MQPAPSLLTVAISSHFHVDEVLRLVDVSFVRDERTILAPLTWKVLPGQRWVVLGANGSGKTTLLRIASMYEHPSTGDVRVLGERLGRTDVRVLRRRIGYMSPSLAAQLRPELRCLDIVMTAKYAALEPWWHRYDEADEARARLPRTDGCRLARRSAAGNDVVGRTATRAAGPHVDERAGGAAARRAERTPRPRWPRATGAGAGRTDHRSDRAAADPRDPPPRRGAARA